MIAGFLLMFSWMATLLSVTLTSISEVVSWSFRRVARWASRKKARGGVADKWLDGPA